jgi:hypothetical protein
MSFLNRSLLALAVAGGSLLPAHAQHWPRTPVSTFATQAPCSPCQPGVVPSYPSALPPGQTVPPGQVVPSYPSVPPMTTTPGTAPSPAESMLNSPLGGQVQPIQTGLGEDTAFVDRGGSSALTSLTPLIGDMGVGGYRPRGPRNSSGKSNLQGDGSAVPIIARSAFKITENESPQPVNRLFVTYNYFNDVRGSDRFDFHREIFGFEKTLLQGRASFGIRLPFLQTVGPNGLSETGLGNISMIGKYAFYNDPDQGLLLSTGAVLTIPSGSTFQSLGLDPSDDAVFVQPFVGGVYDLGRFYVQGFTSLAVPTETNQTVFLFNSFGMNYRLYQNNAPGATVRFVIPTVEGHLTTPLNNRSSPNRDGGFPDLFALTAGTQMGLFNRVVVKTGVSVPLTGPKPHSVEGVFQINLLY